VFGSFSRLAAAWKRENKKPLSKPSGFLVLSAISEDIGLIVVTVLTPENYNTLEFRQEE